MKKRAKAKAIGVMAGGLCLMFLFCRTVATKLYAETNSVFRSVITRGRGYNKK